MHFACVGLNDWPSCEQILLVGFDLNDINFERFIMWEYYIKETSMRNIDDRYGCSRVFRFTTAMLWLIGKVMNPAFERSKSDSLSES